MSNNNRAELVANVKALSAEGKTQRQSAINLGLALGTVNKYLKEPNVHDAQTVHGFIP